MDAWSVLVGFGAGVLWSELGRRVLAQPAERPLRLAPLAMVAPVIVSDDAIDRQWQTAVVRFAVAAELAGSLSLNAMQTATTISKPAWYEYLSVLRGVGVVTDPQERQRTTWAPEFYERAGGCPARHLRSLIRCGGLIIPYPTRRPKTFHFRAPDAQMAQHSTDGTGSTE